MDAPATPLHLPPNLPYPITITRINTPTDSNVSRGSKLLEYSFRQSPAGPSTSDHKTLMLFGSWDCSLEGTVETWNVKVGQTLSLVDAKAISAKGGVVFIKEKCRHDVQIGGMCAVCGEDMTRIDYMGFSPASVATLPSTHLADGPTVSLEEAKRLADEEKEWLMAERKLSLIVDLDQTVVHATVDPTVGEWINEGRIWEAEQVALEDTSGGGGSKTKKKKKPPNPNWPAMKDVASFKLAPEIAGLKGVAGGGGRGKAPLPGEGSTYYIKPRPGWSKFLQNLSKHYDLHIYTMGTRSYALQVLNVLDPDQKLFGNQVLSRDESGSLSFKSLKRLFPVDTSMVVVIDDRGDVWEWCENLVKVKPYDFFVGIGDINSAFLPKQQPLVPSSAPANGSSTPATPTSSVAIPGDPSPEEDVDSTFMQMKEQGRILEAQMEDRPLAKEQEKLNDGSATGSNASASGKDDRAKEGDASGSGSGSESELEDDDDLELRALLTNDDNELERVEGVLMEVHKRFFDAYDAAKEMGLAHGQNGQNQNQNGDTGQGQSRRIDYDVTKIIPRIRKRTFEGVHLLFSSIIPLDQNPATSEVWRQARLYGAMCHSDLNNAVTHVVAAKPGTIKVDMARRKGGIFIVKAHWFTDSMNAWERQDEQLYLLDPSPRRERATKSPIETYSQQPVDVEGHDPGGVVQAMIDEFEEDADDDEDLDEDLDIEAQQELEPIALGTWQDATDEVDAYLMESDSELGDGEETGDIVLGEGESESGSVPGTPRSGRVTPRSAGTGAKRRRSITPSGLPGKQLELGDKALDELNLRSPLAKRKKLADQRGSSGLREEIGMKASPEDVPSLTPPKQIDLLAVPDSDRRGEASEYGSEFGDASSIASEDDFLAAELETE